MAVPQSKPAIRPHWAWFIVAGLCVVTSVAAVVVGVVLGVGRFIATVDDFQRVVVPGEGVVTFAGPEDVTIYHEFRTTLQGERFDAAAGVAGLRVFLVSEATGNEVPLVPYTSSFTYETGTRSGQALFTASIPQAGNYVLGAEAGDGSLPTVLAIGSTPVGTLVAPLVVGVLVAAVLVVVALILTIVVAIKRSRARRALQGPPLPPGGYGWGPAGPGPGAGPGYGGPVGPGGPPPAPPVS